MKSQIILRKVWSDDDLVQIEVSVSNGNSLFVNKVYTTQVELERLVNELAVYREHIHGGIYDIRFGEFGPEYGGGAFQGRLHFKIPGTLFISTYQQTDFEEFSVNLVASEAKLHLRTEPVFLDKFISQLEKLLLGNNDKAVLECRVGTPPF